ncbi:MAG: hypothetical protein ACKVOL_02600 [Novosphingobium sp.]
MIGMEAKALSSLVVGALAAAAAPALAQNVPGAGHTALALSGFQTVAAAAAPDGAERGTAVLSESEIEASGLVRTNGGGLFGVRAAVNLTATTGYARSLWRASVPEWSVFAVGSFGRIELGERAGFPQSLVGFTPSEIAFTSAPFGPGGGTRLDPDGRLPTRALPAPLAARIDGLSSLGFAARLYRDRSAKIVWITPRSRSGFYGAFSYTPRVTRSPGLLLGEGTHSTSRPRGPLASAQPALAQPALAQEDLIQAAAVWNHRSSDIELTLGATVSHVRERGADMQWRGTGSVSAGLTATLRDTWTFGLSATVDDPPTPGIDGHPYGVVTSLDWVSGPWVVGGYVQHARSARTTASTGAEVLDVAEAGASLQIDRNHDLFGAGRYTDARIFAAAYHYRLSGTESAAPTGLARTRGLVLLAGAQFSFF